MVSWTCNQLTPSSLPSTHHRPIRTQAWPLWFYRAALFFPCHPLQLTSPIRQDPQAADLPSAGTDIRTALLTRVALAPVPAGQPRRWGVTSPGIWCQTPAPSPASAPCTGPGSSTHSCSVTFVTGAEKPCVTGWSTPGSPSSRGALWGQGPGLICLWLCFPVQGTSGPQFPHF